jgi:hypothetical protein
MFLAIFQPNDVAAMAMDASERSSLPRSLAAGIGIERAPDTADDSTGGHHVGTTTLSGHRKTRAEHAVWHAIASDGMRGAVRSSNQPISY